MSNPSDHPETESTSAARFVPRASVEQVEEGMDLAPRFDRDGLIACVTTDATSDEVLMLGYMNREALEWQHRARSRASGCPSGD